MKRVTKVCRETKLEKRGSGATQVLTIRVCILERHHDGDCVDHAGVWRRG